MTRVERREVLYFYVVPFSLTISYGYAWLIAKAVSKYLFEAGTVGFWAVFAPWVVLGLVAGVMGMRYARKSHNTALTIIYVVLLLLGTTFLLLLGAMSSVGAPVA
jgi:hypothetical protein